MLRNKDKNRKNKMDTSCTSSEAHPAAVESSPPPPIFGNDFIRSDAANGWASVREEDKSILPAVFFCKCSHGIPFPSPTSDAPAFLGELDEAFPKVGKSLLDRAFFDSFLNLFMAGLTVFQVAVLAAIELRQDDEESIDDYDYAVDGVSGLRF